MHVDLPDKRYYGIGELAKAFDVNPSLIRFWEKEFDILKPKKNAKGNRKFTSGPAMVTPPTTSGPRMGPSPASSTPAR